MLKGPRGLLVTLLGAALIIVGAFVFGFKGQKGDADTSRAFLAHVAAGEISEAYGLLHASITQETSQAELMSILEGMDTYTEVNFPSISFSTVNGRRTTELTGTGTTANGCESEMFFALLNGAITGFDISPLCRVQGTDL